MLRRGVAALQIVWQWRSSWTRAIYNAARDDCAFFKTLLMRAALCFGRKMKPNEATESVVVLFSAGLMSENSGEGATAKG